MPDFSHSAESLGVSEQALMQAMQDAGGPSPHMDMSAIAASLGVTEQALQEALPKPPGR